MHIVFTPKDDERASIIEVMGDELGTAYYLLYGCLLRVNYIWGHYRNLFAESKERVELLNQVGDGLFALVQETLYESVMLELCRLTDKEIVAGCKTASIRRLPDLVDDEARPRMQKLVDVAVDSTETIRRMRNNYIAHMNLEQASSSEMASPYPSRKSIEDSIIALTDVLNHAAESKSLSAVDFSLVRLYADNSGLLQILRHGVDYGRG